jgi:hypothetical protein
MKLPGLRSLSRVPTELGPPADYVQAPSLAFSPSGTGLAGWLVRQQPTDAGGLPGAFDVNYRSGNDGYSSRIATLAKSGAPGAPRTLSGSLAAGPDLDHSGHGLVLRTLALSSDDNGNRRQRVTWSTIAPNGTVGQAHHLVTATLVDPPALAVDPAGDALVSWSEYLSPVGKALWGRYRVRAAWRRAGDTTFPAPVTLLETDDVDFEHDGATEAAIGADGHALVTFADVHANRHGEVARVLAWTRTRSHGFGSTLVAGPHDGYAQVACAVAANGRAVVVWGSQDGGEEADEPWIVRAATLAPGAHHFSPMQTLDPAPTPIVRKAPWCSPWAPTAARPLMVEHRDANG